MFLFYFLNFYYSLSRILVTTLPTIVENPCDPSPCGPNSQCRVVGSQPACSCLPNYIGRAPNCRPECTTSNECPNNLACQNEKCRDPCPGTCGQNAQCTVVNHNPICSCLPGYEGDPVTLCNLIPPSKNISTKTSPYFICIKINVFFLSQAQNVHHLHRPASHHHVDQTLNVAKKVGPELVFAHPDTKEIRMIRNVVVEESAKSMMIVI